MSEHIELAIQDIQAKLRLQEEEVLQTKRTVNQLCRVLGKPEMYQDAEAGLSAASLFNLRSDQFYGQPLASAVRSILDMRKAGNHGAASVAEIFRALKEGGYHFDTKDDENAKRTLRISLTKNPIFHRVPNGEYGLASWYPNAKKPKKDDDAEADDEQPEASVPATATPPSSDTTKPATEAQKA